MTESKGLAVEASHLTVRGADGHVAVDDVCFSVGQGEVVGLVGETGSGKTLTVRACLGLLPAGVSCHAGRLALLGRDLAAADRRGLREVLGLGVGFVPQNTSNFLHPLLRVVDQLVDGYLTWHPRVERARARSMARDLLDQTGIEDPDRVLRSYPVQLSGGMRQRVNVAMALMGDPSLVVADEPTAALDALTRSQVADLLVSDARGHGRSLVLVSHDLGLVSAHCDKVVVMYAGRIVEEGPCGAVVSSPAHPYAASLMASVPRLGRSRDERLPETAGSMPETGRERSACTFAPRCGSARDRCFSGRPAWSEVRDAPGHRALCLHPREGGEDAGHRSR